MAEPLPTFQLPYRIDQSDPDFAKKIQANFDRLAGFVRYTTGKAETIGDYNISDIDDINTWSKDAYDGTQSYRTQGAPTNAPTPSGIQVSHAPNGTMLTTLSWEEYQQGTIPADFLLLFMSWSSDEDNPPGEPSANDPSTSFAPNVSASARYTIPGLNPSYLWSFGIAAARKSEYGLEVGPIQSPSMWQDKTIGTPDFIGTVDGIEAEAIESVITNFNSRNDRIGVIPAAPVIPSGGNALTHSANADGSCDIDFVWVFNGAGDSYNIDGFLVHVRSSYDDTPYTFGTNALEEQTYYMKPDARIFHLYGMSANKFYTFGIQAYRDVDEDIELSGRVKSSIVKPSHASENPYQPIEVPDFTGTIDGTPSEDISAVIYDGGIMQTWQETNCGNIDSSVPLLVPIYIPANTIDITKAILRLRLLEYQWSDSSGITLEDLATDISIEINGDDVTEDLDGPFDTDQDALDILPYLENGWNDVVISSTEMGRIHATVFIQANVDMTG